MKKVIIGILVAATLATGCSAPRYSAGYRNSCSKQNKRYVHHSFINM